MAVFLEWKINFPWYTLS